MIVENLPKRSDTVSIASILRMCCDYPLVIPNKYQREYAWSRNFNKSVKNTLQIFLEDFYEAVSLGPKNNLVFGNNICVASNEEQNIYHLSDGQQRITTCFIFGVLLAKLTNNQNYLKRFFLESTDHVDQLRLQHSSDIFNTFFHNTILEFESEIIPVVDAQQQMYRFIESKPDFDAEKWFQYLNKNVYVNIIYIDIKDEAQYFKDVNWKGLGLDRVDIIKMDIINKSSNIDFTTNLWQETMMSVQKFGTVFVNKSRNSLLETLISWALYINGSNDTITTRNLEHKVKLIDNPDSFIKLIKALADSGYKMLYEDKAFKFLKMINGGNFIPAYIKLVKNYKVDKQKAINYLFYRFLFESVHTAQEANAFYGGLSEDLSVRVDYALMDNISYRNTNKVKALLCTIESIFNPDVYNWDLSGKNVTIEHISSQQRNEDNYDSIGNLTLLNKSHNSRLNKAQEKYPIYRESEFQITKCLCEDYIPVDDHLRLFKNRYYCKGYTSQQIDAFNPVDFEYRKKQLLDSLVKILNLDIK